jgi:hypothetical protein
VAEAEEALTGLGNSVGTILGAGGVGYVSSNVGSAELNRSSWKQHQAEANSAAMTVDSVLPR